MIKMPRMVWVLLGSGLIAGCQSGLTPQFAAERTPERLGLTVVPLRDFAREGILATQPRNLGRAYAENGALIYRVLRITNRSARGQTLYPRFETYDETVVTVHQRFVASQRPRFADWIAPSADTYSTADYLTDYGAEFAATAFEFAFESGGTDPVRRADVPILAEGERGVLLRPGESAEFRIRLRLRPGWAPIVGRVLSPGFRPENQSPRDADLIGTFFNPPENEIPAATKEGRDEFLVRTRIRSHFRIRIVVAAPDGEFVPLFLSDLAEEQEGGVLERNEVLRNFDAANGVDIQSPEPKFRFPGLAILG